MSRIALFVVVVGALVYLVLERVLEPWLGFDLGPVSTVSVAVICGMLAWTAFLLRMGDRLGQREGAWHDDGKPRRGDRAGRGDGVADEGRRGDRPTDTDP